MNCIKQACSKQHSSQLKHLTHHDQQRLSFRSAISQGSVLAQYCLTSTLMSWAMGQSAPAASLQRLQNEKERLMDQMAVLPFRRQAGKTGRQGSHEVQQRQKPSPAPGEE